MPRFAAMSMATTDSTLSRSTETSLAAVLRLFAASAALEQRLAPTLHSLHDLSFPEFLLLLNVARAPLGKMRRVDLAAALNVGFSSISHMADPLEKEGLIERQTDKRDTRVIYASITAAGRQRVEEAEQSVARLTARLFDERWSDADVQAFASRLAQLTYGLPSNLVE